MVGVTITALGVATIASGVAVLASALGYFSFASALIPALAIYGTGLLCGAIMWGLRLEDQIAQAHPASRGRLAVMPWLTGSLAFLDLSALAAFAGLTTGSWYGFLVVPMYVAGPGLAALLIAAGVFALINALQAPAPVALEAVAQRRGLELAAF